MIKKAKNTAIKVENVIQKGEDAGPMHPIDKPYTEFTPCDPVWAESKITARAQVLELPNSDYINTGLNLAELRGYNLKSISIVKGRNTVIEIFR